MQGQTEQPIGDSNELSEHPAGQISQSGEKRQPEDGEELVNCHDRVPHEMA